MVDSKRGANPERDWNAWLDSEGEGETRTAVSTMTLDEDEEEDLHGAPDNRGVIDKIWDALRGGEDMEEADQNLGKAV